MLEDIGRRGDGRVIVRVIEIRHLLPCFTMFCFVLSGEYHCNLCVCELLPPPPSPHEKGMW